MIKFHTQEKKNTIAKKALTYLTLSQSNEHLMMIMLTANEKCIYANKLSI